MCHSHQAQCTHTIYKRVFGSSFLFLLYVHRVFRITDPFLVLMPYSIQDARISDGEVRSRGPDKFQCILIKLKQSFCVGVAPSP